MRLILIGCEYSGTTTLAEGVRGWSNEAMGKPESTEGRPWGQPLKKLEGAPLNLG